MTLKERLAHWVIHRLAQLQAWIAFRFLKRRFWRSFDGRVTPIDELKDSHLHNCIRLLLRQGDEKTDMYRALMLEYDRRKFAREMGAFK